ncbi:MAG: acyl--CoA ligase [Deltaproteobacteria bacterium]|nr:acyl--CoA ligase [Deltaproteobacteria bacterium]
MYEHLRAAWAELTAPGAPFEVAELVVRGAPMRTWKTAAPSLREVWLSSTIHGELDHLVYEDDRWTFNEAHREAASVAAWLAEQGVGPGDHVAIAMRNYPEWMLAYWATVSMGATVVGMNAWWTGPELLYGVQDAEPKVMICDTERLERFAPHRSQAPDCTLVGVRCRGAASEDFVPWSALRRHGGEMPDVQIDPDSDACVFYTSGTTGRPKGAQLTHRGCVANLLSLAFWNLAAGLAGRKAKGDAGNADAKAAPRLAQLVTTPLFHVTANNCVAQSAAMAGGKLVHMYKWDPAEALRLIERERVTHMSGVPMMSRELIAHPDFAETDTSSLKAIGGGGAQLQPDLVTKLDETVETARPSTGYGMTETCGIITAISADFFVDKPESVGPASPVFEAKCVDDSGETVDPNQVGELWVRGAQVIRGYLNRPEATTEGITDGWLHTGDIARIDADGFIFIVDRAKDMVLRGGENVYCAEVESAIFEHDDVAECAVFGVPDDRFGEEVAAVVAVRKDATVTGDQLREHCAARIAKYKIPRYIWLQSELLPRNASGKFLKRQLRDELEIGEAV